MACMVRAFPLISLLSIIISLRFFFTEERSYQGLKGATLFGLLSDKSAEKLEGEYSKNYQFSILAAWLTRSLHFLFCMQISQVTSLPGGSVLARWPVWRTTSNISNIWA